jgi:hypothetical protein
MSATNDKYYKKSEQGCANLGSDLPVRCEVRSERGANQRSHSAKIYAVMLSGLLVSFWSGSSHSQTYKTPQLKWGKPVHCVVDGKKERFRYQCEKLPNGRQRCWFAADHTIPFNAPLDRAQFCDSEQPANAYSRMLADGTEVLPARADVQPGFARDETGQAFQVQFDLLKRYYLGALWLPTLQHSEKVSAKRPNFPLGRFAFEGGFTGSFLSHSARTRHDLTMFEGSVTIDDFQLNGLFLAYDYQLNKRRPMYHLTTFFGTPKRYDVAANLGTGFRILRFEGRTPSARDTKDLEFGEAHLGLNLWSSDDMYNRLRVEAGGDAGRIWDDRQLKEGPAYGGFTSAVHFRATLGSGGLHYLFLDANYQRFGLMQGVRKGTFANKVQGSIAYELIMVAINDQPLSFRLGAASSFRDDISSGQSISETTFQTGLRFSFWAPPRDFEPLPPYEED